MFFLGGLSETNPNSSKSMELQLFSEEEMRSGSRSTDYFDLYEDAYLEAMRLICSLDDFGFYKLNEEYNLIKREIGRSYYLRNIPGKVLTSEMFYALGEMIALRHYHNNHFYNFTKPHILIASSSFYKARERFLKELANERYVNTEWIMRIER